MYVNVAGWATPRQIIEGKDNFLFEVAEDDGCSICAGRIRHVESVLRSKNIAPEFRTMRSQFGPCLFVVLEPAPPGVDPRDHVGQLLNLSIG
jgi:hypothetical protein